MVLLQMGSSIAARLSESPATAIPILFVTGVLTSLTPCIYPMIPITAAIVGGQSVGRSTRRGVALTLVYVLGLSLVYALLGLLAGLTRTLFGTVSASPWAAILTGNLLLLFGLWMLDAIPIRIPAALLGGRFGGNAGTGAESVSSLGSAFVMGCASGLVAAPCSAPVLGAVLTWVAVTRSAVLGFVYLFVFSIGMCTLLVAVGIFGASFARLPRSGMWMVWVKRILAVVMIGAAEYYFVHAGMTM
ncbi:MAG: sulfite exporter TauE/SafE family protein [Gemmatimonadota bacterium]|nr:sulfite exporter TauE/SafE family protein [Gemmatimonadota bacterium]